MAREELEAAEERYRDALNDARGYVVESVEPPKRHVHQPLLLGAKHQPQAGDDNHSPVVADAAPTQHAAEVMARDNQTPSPGYEAKAEAGEVAETKAPMETQAPMDAQAPTIGQAPMEAQPPTITQAPTDIEREAEREADLMAWVEAEAEAAQKQTDAEADTSQEAQLVGGRAHEMLPPAAM